MTTEGAKNLAVRQDYAQEALDAGFPLSCATCQHLFRAWDAQAPDCGKTATCGGPMLGRDFPDYEGKIPSALFADICLVCASPSIAFRVVVPDKEKRFALCEKHKDRFDSAGAGTTEGRLTVRPVIIAVTEQRTWR